MNFSQTNWVAVALAAAALLTSEGVANELVLSHRYVNVDYVSVGCGGMRTWLDAANGSPRGTRDGAFVLTGVPTGSVTKALLYWHGDAPLYKQLIPGGPWVSIVAENPVASVVFRRAGTAGGPVSAQAVYAPDRTNLGIASQNGHESDPGYELGAYSQSFVADVTALVTGDGTYEVSGFVPSYVNVNGASLLVLFDDGIPGNNVDVSIFHGNDALLAYAGYDSGGWALDLGALTAPLAGSLNIEFHVSDSQSYMDGPLVVNGQMLNASEGDSLDGYATFRGEAPFASSDYAHVTNPEWGPDGVVQWLGSMWDVRTYDIAPLLTRGVSTQVSINHSWYFDEYSLVAAVVIVPTGTFPISDPGGNTPPTLQCPPPVARFTSVNAGTEVSLQASCAETDGDAVTMEWKLNGSAVAVRTVTFPPGGGTDTLTMIFPPGQTDIDVTVRDGRGAPVTCSSTVSVTIDIVPPTATLPPAPVPVIPDVSGVSLMPNLAALLGATDNRTDADRLTYSQTPAPGTVLAPGNHVVTVTITDEAGNSTTVSVTVTVPGTPPPPEEPGACNLYPIALHKNTLLGVQAGATVTDIYNGTGPGNFGWLTWAGSPNVPTLVQSLTVPGDSYTYVNPFNVLDHCVSVGDWVQGSPGVSNASEVRNRLDILKNYDITVPIYDTGTATGNNRLFHVVGFAMVRITDYRLPNQNRISVTFLGNVDCGCPTAPPPPPPPAPGCGGGDDDDDDDHADGDHRSDDDDRDERNGSGCNRNHQHDRNCGGNSNSDRDDDRNKKRDGRRGRP